MVKARLDSTVQVCDDGVAMSDETQDEFELEYFEVSGDGPAANGSTGSIGWYWKVTSTGNYEVIIKADEPFDSKSNAQRNFELVQRALLSL